MISVSRSLLSGIHINKTFALFEEEINSSGPTSLRFDLLMKKLLDLKNYIDSIDKKKVLKKSLKFIPEWKISLNHLEWK